MMFLNKKIKKEEVLKKVDIDYSKKIILYMPTYRGALLGEKAMERIVTDLYNNESLDRALTLNNYIFIAKLHPLTPYIGLKNRNNFIILDNLTVESNQKLLGVADILISDYSSCSIDYALLKRPIIFYLPDKKEFIEKSEPLYDIFFDICKENECTTPNDVAKAIINPSYKGVNALNEFFNDSTTENTNYCQNVYEVIYSHINNKLTFK